MKTTRSLIFILIALILVSALYRIIPGRPLGFFPQLSMALFAGAVIKDKKWAFAFPIFSLFISDLFFHLLFLNGLVPYAGFYEGQITNYLLFAAMTVIGFFMKKISVGTVAGYSFIVAVVYFLLSNFFVWQSGAGFARPKTFSGLMQCYIDGLPFLGNSLISTLAFSALLFGGWALYRKSAHATLAV